MSEAPSLLSPQRERLLLGTLAAVQFTHVMDFMVMMPLGPQLMRVFDLTPGQFSYLVASYGLAAAVTGFLGGFVLDRFGRRRALLTLFGGFGLATLACALAPTYAALLAARTIAGGFGGVAGSVVVAMVGDVVPPERRGQAMGVVMTAFPLASVLGIPVALALAAAYEWHAPFFLLAALSVVVLVFARTTLPPLVPAHPPAAPWRQMRTILTAPVHHKGLSMSAMLVFAGGCVIPFLAPAMVANVRLSEAQLPWIYFAGGLVTLFTNPWLGRLSDRHDKLRVLGVVTAAAGFVVLAITRLPVVPLGIAMAMTAAFMVTMSGRFSPAMAMLTNAVEARYRGGFMSVNSAVQQLASGVANVVAGLLVTRTATGDLAGFENLGYLSVGCLGLTYVLAARLKAAAPHASRPAAETRPGAPRSPYGVR
jgi:MFS transporter, DHA1 family, inner membrane transport protein